MNRLCTLIALVLVAILAVFMPAHTTLAQCPISWYTQQNSSTSVRPWAIAAGDFNGDATQDMAIVSYYNDKISILMGQGNGTFQPPVGNPIYNLAGGPRHLVIADFNQDTKLDLAVVRYSGTGVHIYLGNGNGTFQSPDFYETNYNSRWITLGDFNADGRADLAIASENGASGAVAVLMGKNNNPGTLFYGAEQTPTVPYAYSVAVGDFNADQKPDLAVLQWNGSGVAILLGDLQGHFMPSASYPGGSGASYAIVASDFNEDGYSDVAVANSDNGTVTVLLSAGGGALKPSALYFTSGTNPSHMGPGLVVEDIDEDGDRDIIVANYASNSFKILRGTGAGTFLNGGRPLLGPNPSSIVVIDTNNDQKKDVVVACDSTLNIISIELNASTSGPEITKHPLNQRVWNGYDVALSISATNVVSYQWRFNGVNLSNENGVSGVNGPVLTVSQAAITDEGQYDCIVTNGCGSITSNASLLEIYPPCLGDFNRDGQFDGLDVSAVVQLLLEGPTCYPCK